MDCVCATQESVSCSATVADLQVHCSYLNRALGWDQTKTDSLLLPLIKREQERKAGAHSKQPVMTDL